MKRLNTIAVLVLVAVLVTAIGAFAGWFVVLRSKGQTISFQDAARGFGLSAPSANQNGSTFNNIGAGGGGGFAVNGASNVPANTNAGGASANTAGSEGNVASGGAGQDVSTGAGTSTAASTNSQALAQVVVPKTPRLWHVIKTPVAGFTFATSSTSVYFSERATGYIFTADAISGELLRRTNTLLPKTYEAYLQRNGGAIYRSINDATGVVQTFTGIIGSSTSPNVGSLIGVNLRNNIAALDANPDTKTLFYLFTDGNKTTGYTMPWAAGKNSKETTVFTSPIASWRPYALSDGRLMVLLKPEDGGAGYAYEILANGTLKPLVRGAPGLTFLPRSGSSAFAFGTSAGGVLTMYAQTDSGTVSLPIKTVADKCVWSPVPAGKKKVDDDPMLYCAVPGEVGVKNFLESWYMGALHTNDTWWAIHILTGKSEKILSGETSAALDVWDPKIDPTGQFIAFKNGADGSLWILRVAK